MPKEKMPQESVPEPAAAASEVIRPLPSTEGLSAAQYAAEAMSFHQQQYKGQGTPPPGILKWFGDAALAVAPINRMSCAIGLTGGLMGAGTLAKIATGYTLDGKAVELNSVPTFLQKLHKVVKNYNPAGLDSRNRWIKYGQWAAYSLGGFIGIKLGTDYAYHKVHERNRDPHYIEDYLTRVSMHQGETWSWLAAFSGIFGSASGLFTLPIPGLNYGIGMAGRTTSMQDRNIMLKDVNGMLSGATTPSYLRLKEGTHYLCHYAVANPAQTPTQLEYLAYTLLGPVFGDQLNAEDIKEFAEAVHKVRDHYWQPGGIPREKRAEAIATMKEVFTGAGLEVLLIGMGLNPGTIAFDKLNGLSGTIGNIGALSVIKKEQAEYLAALQERLPKYVADGEISQARADWVVAGIEAMKQGHPLPPPIVETELPVQPTAVPGVPHEPVAPPPAIKHVIKHPPHSMTDQETRNIEKLIKKAEQPDDWRVRVTGQKQDTRDLPLIE